MLSAGQRLVVVTGAVALAGWAAMALVIGGGPAACAPPPRGWHQVFEIWPYVWIFGPPTVTFFVTAYLALGLRSPVRRWLALLGCIGLSVLVFYVAVVFLPFTCGQYAP